MSVLLSVGLVNRETLAIELNVDPETLLEWERAGMPVIKVRRASFYDIKKVAAWIRKVGKAA